MAETVQTLTPRLSDSRRDLYGKLLRTGIAMSEGTITPSPAPGFASASYPRPNASDLVNNTLAKGIRFLLGL